ncbi:MAG TPA: hypothetical protein VJU14_13285 [Solirubrobacterales bacterium]|nr:hypothetical protein [Solirubrobacterales bacterium]
MRLSATTAKWIALALLGLAISAGVAVAASNLVSRQIGIASESVSAGDELAPAVESAARTEGPEENGSGSAAPQGTPDPDDDGVVGGSGDEDRGGAVGGGSADVSEDELDDRIDEEEDARDEAEDAADDRADELEDLADDNSGKGSDD